MVKGVTMEVNDHLHVAGTDQGTMRYVDQFRTDS